MPHPEYRLNNLMSPVNSLESRIQQMGEKAIKDAVERLPHDAGSEARNRVISGITRYLLPAIEENEIITANFRGEIVDGGHDSETYPEYAKRILRFLGTSAAAVVCPDGRISNFSIIDPHVGRLHRRLQGMPETRPSSKKRNVFVLEDHRISAAIENSVRENSEDGKRTHLVEYLGPHVNTLSPEHGCGAATLKLTAQGRPAINAMRFGGIYEFYEELGPGYFAFANAAQNIAHDATIVDFTHDAASQGLIFGLKSHYDQKGKNMFDHDRTLRENLVTMHKNGSILMTEFLGDTTTNGRKFEDVLRAIMNRRGIAKNLNMKDPYKLAENIITIGNVAMELTAVYESLGFPFLPDHLKKDMHPDARRTVAYHAARNYAYLYLGNIATGRHDLFKHNEKLIASGPVVPSSNVENIPFIQITTGGLLGEEDKSGIKKLYGLLGNAMTQEDLKESARIIVLTETFDPLEYADRKRTNRRLTDTVKLMESNNAHVRQMLQEGVDNGETVVVGLMMHPDGRYIQHVV